MTNVSESMDYLQAGSNDLLAGLQRFQSVLADLQVSHERLEKHAERMEAELEVSNRQLAEKVEELDHTNQYLEAILESLPSAVIVRDAQGKITRVNPACQALLEAPAAEWIGCDQELEIRPSADAAGLHECTSPHGHKRIVARTCNPVFGRQGDDLGSVEILSDQTELTRATARVHQQSKMAALGSMAGGIAHEIRNPMNAVRGFAALLTRPGVSVSDQKRFAQRIEQGVQEVETIITGLLNLASPGGLHLETLQAESLLQEALQLVQREEACQAIDWRVEAEALEFSGDRIQLRQALRNLIANALQAQAASGPLLVRATQDGDQVAFEIHDSGPGMPTSDTRRLIDPFYTTRADGMGLGLSLVDSIARLHGGELDLNTNPSQLGGALVRLCLPTS